MGGIYFLIVLIVFFVVYEVESFRYRSSTKDKIKKSFGKIPQIREFDFKEIETYWNIKQQALLDDNYIDAITWNDLDMNKVYQRINQCASFVGDQYLYSILHQLPKETNYNEKLEKKIKYFTENQEEREKTQFLLSNLKKIPNNYLSFDFVSSLGSDKLPSFYIFRLLQIFLILSFLPFIVLQNTSFLLLPVLFFSFNFLINFVIKSKYDNNLNLLSSVAAVIHTTHKLHHSKKFHYHNQFPEAEVALKTLLNTSKRLSSIVTKKQSAVTGDPIAAVFEYLQGGTLIDLIRYIQISRALTKHSEQYLLLFEWIGEIDLAISIASFRLTLPFYAYPTFINKSEIICEELYHPLIDHPVANSLSLDKSCIITGSNASGKSTYIKAFTINLILAQNINTCLAKSMFLPRSMVMTSMAVRDDLSGGESYYIKEIKYLKRILDQLSEDRILVCAVDEILRGTNTEERIAASYAILEFLHSKNCLVLVASHDIELTSLLNRHYYNFHFSEKMDEQDIIFDYKIYPGPSISKNAIRLLEHVGFPNEIIHTAKNLSLL